MIFGVDLDVGTSDNSRIIQLQAAMKVFFTQLFECTTGGVKLHLYFPTARFRKFKRSMDDLMKIPKVYLDQSYKRIKQAVEKGDQYHGQCFLEQLLIERKLPEKEVLSRSTLLFGAALDTVSFRRHSFVLITVSHRYTNGFSVIIQQCICKIH